MKRKWYHEEVKEKVVTVFKEKYPVFNKEIMLSIIKTGNFHEIRQLATTIADSNYVKEEKDGYSNLDYEDKKEIINALNKWFETALGEDLSILFKDLVKSQKHELWNGDEKYRLLCIGGALPYYPRQVIKSAICLLHDFVGKEITVDNLKIIHELYTTDLNWDLVRNLEDEYKYDWEHDDAAFKLLNDVRRKQTESWITFIDYILNKRYDDAYLMIVNYSKERTSKMYLGTTMSYR